MVKFVSIKETKMKNKFSTVISLLLTVFVLTIIGGVSYVIAHPALLPAANTSGSSSLENTREAQYNQLIAQANERIAQANQEILSLQAQVNQAVEVSTATPYPVSIYQAISIAVRVSGENINQTPALVNYSGTVAYEVVFPSGNVYVDANTGSVLYNGVLASKTISSQQAGQIAINYTGNSQVTEVVGGVYNGFSAYRVTFTNGQIVYVNTYGSILAVQPAPVSSSGGDSEHESDDD
jgi:uncharacterized membrane protein YkoI